MESAIGTISKSIRSESGVSSHVLKLQSYSPARVPFHLGSLVSISRFYLTSSSQQNGSMPARSLFATLLGGLLLCRLVQIDIAAERTSVLALKALLPILPLSVVRGTVLVVGAAFLVPAVVSRPNAVLVVALLFKRAALVLRKERNG
jgi:hypothetical protein